MYGEAQGSPLSLSLSLSVGRTAPVLNSSISHTATPPPDLHHLMVYANQTGRSTHDRRYVKGVTVELWCEAIECLAMALRSVRGRVQLRGLRARGSQLPGGRLHHSHRQGTVRSLLLQQAESELA
jgi:hypothetical protein